MVFVCDDDGKDLMTDFVVLVCDDDEDDDDILFDFATWHLLHTVSGCHSTLHLES